MHRTMEVSTAVGRNCSHEMWTFICYADFYKVVGTQVTARLQMFYILVRVHLGERSKPGDALVTHELVATLNNCLI